METGLRTIRRHETKDKQREMMKRGMDGCFPILRLMDF